MLAPEIREKQIGYAEIRQVFSISRFGKVAGCMVTEGVVKRGATVRLLRDNVVIHEGSLKQPKRFKDDVRAVQAGIVQHLHQHVTSEEPTSELQSLMRNPYALS